MRVTTCPAWRIRYSSSRNSRGCKSTFCPARFTPPYDFIHCFADRRARLEKDFPRLRDALKPAGMLWVSWPKKASGLPTDLTEDTIREIALPGGLVDVKVCAVDETWSGLKLVVRKSER